MKAAGSSWGSVVLATCTAVVMFIVGRWVSRNLVPFSSCSCSCSSSASLL